MTSLEKDLHRALVELDEAVASMTTAQAKPDLLAHFARIDGLAAQLPTETDPHLVHFLQRKSYQKARACLEQQHSHWPSRE